jgi:transcriptional regulator with XRE-family HTH domain
MNLAFILKELRLLKRVTQQCIADKLNVERSTYTKWETGRVTIRIDQLQKIALIYGLDLEYIGRCVEAQKIISKNDVERFIHTQEEREKNLSLRSPIDHVNS